MDTYHRVGTVPSYKYLQYVVSHSLLVNVTQVNGMASVLAYEVKTCLVYT
jgi:hypothetical protein